MGEKETGAADEAERLKTKTKSNQSNDRTDQGGGGAVAAATDVTNDPETTWESSNLAGGAESSPSGEAGRWAVDTTPPDTTGMASGGGGGGAPEAAINTSHSNIKNLREGGGFTHEDDWDKQVGKLAPENPGKSEIAIGDPGVNGNISGGAPEIAIGEPGWNTDIAVSDEGVPAAKPAPKSN